MKAVAILSMLHEPPGRNSATRQFLDRAVLAWTLLRLQQCTRLNGCQVLCWQDQLPPVQTLTAEVFSAGQRVSLPALQAITAARRWSDGWRGGPLSSSEFDLGFSAGHVHAAAERSGADAVVLVNPAAGLVDPVLIDRLVDHAIARPAVEYAFLPIAPGFCAMLLRRGLLERLARGQAFPGRLLTYHPDAPMRDPLAGEACVDVPVWLARTTRRFTLDSQVQVDQLTPACQRFDGTLDVPDAQTMVSRLGAAPPGRIPQDLTVELIPRRVTRPIFLPADFAQVSRPRAAVDDLAGVFAQLAARDDARLTLGGAGDPLLHDDLPEILAKARAAGIAAIHLETDLLPENPSRIDQLAESGIDIISVHVPAVTAA
ncbi:MAG: radical SAM protein, partial [Phycisphaerae bacterium]|nr:radical SAM protein [Phycisphaerae bacterium]